MNVYLDIDGVLLANEENLAIGATEFIKYAVEHFDVYWLTTHCMDGTTEHAIEYLQRGSHENIRPDLHEHNAVNSWIEIDLRNVPDQMIKELVTLQTFTEKINV